MPSCAALVLVLALAACNAEPETPAPRVTGLEWETLAPMPTPRTEVAAAAVGGRIVVVGGFALAGTVGTTEVYDVAADAWSAGPDLPVAVNHAMATSFEDAAYVFGGTLGDGAISDAAFVLSDGAWEPLPLMPEPRTAGGAAVAGGLIPRVGGGRPAGVAERTLVFDPEAGRWSVTEGLGRPREHMGVAAFDDRVYAVGGRAGSLAGFGDVEVLDPGTGPWSPLPDLPTPRGGMAAAAASNGVVAIGTAMYVIAGGVDPGLSFSGAVEAIDLARL